MNSEGIYAKVTSDSGQAAQWAQSDLTPAEIVTNLYLAIYNRFPGEEELNIGIGLYENEGSNRRTATEDLMWALLNTPEFIFKD